MKKRDEGYVLAFVLIVIVVICLVAVSMMNVSLRNVQAQKASIERMEEKYRVQGLYERVFAAMSQDLITFNSTEEDTQNVLKAYLQGCLDSEASKISGFSVTTNGTGNNIESFSLTVTFLFAYSESPIAVLSELKWDAEIAKTTQTINGVATHTYTIKDPAVECTSYEVVSLKDTSETQEVS